MGEGGAVVNVSSDGGYGWRRKRDLIDGFLAAPGFDGGAAWHEQNGEAAGHAYAFGKEALDLWTIQQSQLLVARGIRINTLSRARWRRRCWRRSRPTSRPSASP